MPFDPQLQQAIAAHMQYLRDLGIFEFYRRSSPDDEGTARSIVDSAPAFPPTVEEPVIRKPIPVQPPVGSFVSPPTSMKLATVPAAR
jgi:hypothetical protein